MKKILAAATILMLSISGGAMAQASGLNLEQQKLMAEYGALSTECNAGNRQACKKAKKSISSLEAADMCRRRTEGPNPGSYTIWTDYVPCTAQQNQEKQAKAKQAGLDASPQNKIQGCTIRGMVFQQAAYIRDGGSSPEVALKFTEGYASKGAFGIPLEYIKNAINLVYFDSAFINAGGVRLSDQVRDFCLNDGKQKFKPLK